MATYVGPNAREGELVFGVAHIFASFNDTFVVRVMTRTPDDARGDARKALRRDDDRARGDGARRARVFRRARGGVEGVWKWSSSCARRLGLGLTSRVIALVAARHGFVGQGNPEPMHRRYEGEG